MVWSQCTASRGTYELDGCRFAFGAACCRSKNWISNFAPRSAAYACYEAQMGTLALPHLTSRRSVGSWPPELARSAFDAHWPPPEAWYLGVIRVASCGRICPLTCAKARGESVSCACAMSAAIADAVAAAGCPTALILPPSRRLPTLTPAAPSKHPKNIISPSPLLTTSLPLRAKSVLSPSPT